MRLGQTLIEQVDDAGIMTALALGRGESLRQEHRCSGIDGMMLRQIISRHTGQIILTEDRCTVDQQIRHTSETVDHLREEVLRLARLQKIRDEASPGRACLGKAFGKIAVGVGIMTAMNGQCIAFPGQTHRDARTEAAMAARD